MAEVASLAELILKPASTHRGIRFLRSQGRESVISYAELLQRARCLLATFQSFGMQPGDALVLFVRDNRAFVDAFWACQLGGLIAVPLAAGVRQDALDRLERVGALFQSAWLFSERELWQRCRQTADRQFQFTDRVCLKEEVAESGAIGRLQVGRAEDIAFIQFSSGSTSEPKGIQLSHSSLLANIRDITQAAAIDSADSTLSWMPLSHDMGLVGFHLVPLYNSLDQVLMDTDVFVRRPARWLRAADDYRSTLLCSPGFGFRHYLKSVDLTEEALDLSHVRLIFNGAEPISPTVCQTFSCALNAKGLHKNSMFPVYGLAEASLAVTFPRPGTPLKIESLAPESHELVCLGHPLATCDIRICDDQGSLLPASTIGHVQIQGENVTRGYFQCPDCNKKAFVDGWLDTGDLGFQTEDGLYISGRAKDIIFASGHNWYPQDIEAALQRTAGIDVDKLLVCAVRSENNDEDEVLVFIQHRKAVADFARRLPDLRAALVAATGLHAKAILPVHNLPRTSSGKLQRFRLVDAFCNAEYKQLQDELEAQAESVGPSTASDVEESLLALCRQLFPDHSIAADQNLFELGADSLMLVRIHEEVEARFPGKIGVTDLFDYPTISELAAYIEPGNRS